MENAMTIPINVKINNMTPDCINENTKYIVARLVDDELWYWGSYEDIERSETAAKQFTNALILEVAK